MSSSFAQYKHMTPDQLIGAARARFSSAKELLKIEGHNEDAVYLAGYALEFIVKRHIALSLGWDEYPPEYKEVAEYGGKQDRNNNTFTTHDINKLVTIGGLKKEILDDINLASHWALVLKWQVEMRYCESGYLKVSGAKEIVESILYMIQFIKRKHE